MYWTFIKIKNTFDLKNRMGYTDYIDFLQEEEVPKNIMAGFDKYSRPFITLKVGIINKDTGEFTRRQEVFFQRYSDSPLWMGAYFEGQFLNTSGGMSAEQKKLIDDLICNKTIIIEESHRPFFNINIGDIIANMDVWEKKS